MQRGAPRAVVVSDNGMTTADVRRRRLRRRCPASAPGIACPGAHTSRPRNCAGVWCAPGSPHVGQFTDGAAYADGVAARLEVARWPARRDLVVAADVGVERSHHRCAAAVGEGVLFAPVALAVVVARRRRSLADGSAAGRWRTEASQGAGALDRRGSPHLDPNRPGLVFGERPGLRAGTEVGGPPSKRMGLRSGWRRADLNGGVDARGAAWSDEDRRARELAPARCRPPATSPECGPRSGDGTRSTKGAAPMVLGEIRGLRQRCSSDVADHQERGARVAPQRRGACCEADPTVSRRRPESPKRPCPAYRSGNPPRFTAAGPPRCACAHCDEPGPEAQRASRTVLAASDLAECGPRLGDRVRSTKGAAPMVLGEIRGPRQSLSSDVAQHRERGARVAPHGRGSFRAADPTVSRRRTE